MVDIAKIFMDRDGQAVLLPTQYRFETSEVCIRKDPVTGDVVLSPRPTDWEGFFAVRDAADIPEDFLVNRNEPPHKR
jgi:antitoxin VapB